MLAGIGASILAFSNIPAHAVNSLEIIDIDEFLIVAQSRTCLVQVQTPLDEKFT